MITPGASDQPAAEGELRKMTDDRLDRGRELTRRGDGFSAHEIFEELWREAAPEERDFFQALVHVAIAPYQEARGRHAGSRSQLEKARRRLAPYAPSHHGVDVTALLRWCEESLGSGRCEAPPI